MSFRLAHRWCLPWLALFLLCAGVSAKAADNEAEALVRATVEEFFARLQQDEARNRAEPAHLLETAEEIVLPHFNFVAMAQRALGRHWRDFSEDQRGRFIREFRMLMLRTYAKTVNDHRRAEIRFLPARRLSDQAWRIRTEVARDNGGPPFLIDYEMHREPTGWKAYDVTLDGVSLVVSYRAGFAEDIARKGIEGVIEQLTTRNRQAF